jgi:two-component system, OmpR family, response regulator
VAMQPLMGGSQAASKSQILVVDDDVAIVRIVVKYLENEGYRTAAVSTVAQMRATFESTKVDFVILDVGLPDEDGWSALRWLRGRSTVPVVMFTGKGETIDKVLGLEMGADDYMAKPVEMRELLARIRSIERRIGHAPAPPEAPASETIRFAEWALDLSSQQLKSQTGDAVPLTLAEYRILVLFAQNVRRVISRDQLMDAMAGRSWEPYDRSIDVHISNLRRKLDRDPKLPSLIRTIRGAGYMFVPDRGA